MPRRPQDQGRQHIRQFTKSFCSHQFLHNLKGEQQDIFGYLEAP
jgi:hypothetical protein